MEKVVRAKQLLEHLAAEGYRAEIDEDTDVRFKFEGGSYFISVDATDDAFFRICYPGFWAITNEEERAQVLAACDVANRDVKVVKLYTVGDNVWANFEIFINAPDAYKPMFDRALVVLQTAVTRFVEAMRAPVNAVPVK